MKLTRRRFLRLVAAGTAAACASGGSKSTSTDPDTEPLTTTDTTTTDTETTDTGTVPTTPPDSLQDLIDEALLLLRADPSHRTARAAALVAAGDVGGLFALVRDQVVLQPGRTHLAADAPAAGDDPYANGWGMLYGPRGTLRGGAGLARDKAELLAHLLREAGEDAEVVWVQTSLTPNQAEAARAVRPDDQTIEVPDDLVARWSELAGADLEDTEELPEPTEAEVDALTDRLLALLPAPPTSTYVDDIDGTQLPMVRWNSGSGSPLLCPLHPDATVDDPVLPIGGVTSAEPVEAPSVEVALTALRSGQEGPLELVRHTFTTDELCGRQLILGTQPVASTDELLVAELGQRFSSYLPYLAVQALDDGPTPEPALGTVFTTGGGTVEIDGSGVVLLDGEPTVDPASGADPSSVASVDLEVDATTFPRVVVRAWPRDAGGTLVPGLGRDSLALFDEDILQPATLREVRGDLRVLLLWDESTSMPEAYSGAVASGWLDDIAAALRDARPDARVTVDTFLEDQGEQLAAVVADAGRYDLVLMVTDGETLEDVEAMAPLFAGVPVFLADVYGIGPSFHEVAAEASGGASEAVTEATVEDQLLTWLLDAPEGSYVLDYVAAEEPDGTRSVRLDVGTAQGAGTYDVPAERIGSASRLTGLQLEITSMGRTQRRLLAGLPETLHARYHTPELRRDAFEEVLAVLNGGLTLVAEAGTPGPVQMLDDVFVTALAAWPWVAEDAPDLDAVRDRFEAGLPMVPFGATALADGAESPDAGGAHVHGLRMVLHHHRHDEASGDSYHRVDVLRVHRQHRSSADAPFDETVRASARRALREAATASHDHTLARLDGVPLVAVAPGERPSFTFDQQVDAYWDEVVASAPDGWLLVPDDLTIRAAFWVDPDTGDMVPLIDHGAGGGVDYKKVVYLVRTYIALAGFAAGCGPGLGVVSALMAVIAQYWAVATACVASLSAPDTQRLNDLLKLAVCNIFTAALGAGNLAGPLNLLLSGLGLGFCRVVEPRVPPAP